MILLDSLLIGGIRFVLEKVASAVDAELNDDTTLREELLAAQMRLELGEMTPEAFAELEADLLARLREIRDRQRAAGGGAEVPTLGTGGFKVTGADATTTFEVHEAAQVPEPADGARDRPRAAKKAGTRRRAGRP